MQRVCSIFSQLLQMFPRLEFEQAVHQHHADCHLRGFSCWGQFVAMLFCQLGKAHSLREICGWLAAGGHKFRFQNRLLNLDARVIDLCVSVFDWAQCQRTKGAIKLQLLLDHVGPGDTGFLDEVFVTINGERRYLWRAVDQDGDVLDILVQKRRDQRAAKRFCMKVLKGLRYLPRVIVTDKLGS